MDSDPNLVNVLSVGVIMYYKYYVEMSCYLYIISLVFIFISNLEDIIVDKNTIAKKEHVPKLLRSLKKGGNYTAFQI